MSNDDSPQSQTDPLRFLERPARLRLLVMGDKGAATFPLPASGEILIGRSQECQVYIDDPKLSRRHALLRVGDSIEVIDLGSSNGTRVGPRRLEPNVPAVLSPGDMLFFGTK